MPRGVNIPYSDEFREREHQRGAAWPAWRSLVPKERAAGKDHRRQPASARSATRLASCFDTTRFRHDLAKATSSQDIWHLLVFAPRVCSSPTCSCGA